VATVQEILRERSTKLRELSSQIEEEIGGDADFDRLSDLADQLSAAGDSFAETLAKAKDTLAGEGEGEGGGNGGGGNDGNKKSGK
jgi:molybdopterin converting factor small subunit